MNNEAIIGIISNISKLTDSLLAPIIPEDAKRHFRNACKEALLGMVVILDIANEKEKNNPSDNQNNEKVLSKNINISD